MGYADRQLHAHLKREGFWQRAYERAVVELEEELGREPTDTELTRRAEQLVEEQK